MKNKNDIIDEKITEIFEKLVSIDSPSLKERVVSKTTCFLLF